MRDERLGRSIRVLRQRRGWRQSDLAARAAISPSNIARLEAGDIEGASVRTLRAVFTALGARVSVTPFYKGATLDRLLDERHAILAGRFATILRRYGWSVEAEVSYSRYGERGSIDLLAFHPPTKSLLVVEIKTELPSIEETVRKLDEKQRLAPGILFDRHGWRPGGASRILVLDGTATAHRHVRRHAQVLDLAFPVRAREARRWLCVPVDPISGLWLLSPDRPDASDEEAVRRPG